MADDLDGLAVFLAPKSSRDITSLADGRILHGATRGSEAVMAFPQKGTGEQDDRAFFREQIFQTRLRAVALAAAAMGMLLESMTGWTAVDARGKLQIYVIYMSLT